jgi:LacI family transcriptional regulator
LVIDSQNVLVYNEIVSETFWILIVEHFMPSTLKDIANRVGKSVTTVSRALAGYDDVSPETKAEVRRVADELGYTPNITAQRLQKQRTDTIGFILPTFGPRFSDPFFSEFLAGIGNKAANEGYDLLVSTRPPGEQELETYRKIVRSYRVDGFILVRTRRLDSRVEYLSNENFPFVAFGRTEKTNNYLYIDEDSEYGMYMVANHLADLGHKKIAFIAAPDNFTFAHHRLNGFKKGLSERGLSPDELIITTGDLTQRGGYAQATNILERPDIPTAIAACNDLMAFGAISAAQKRGLIVGKDIAITGFDDIPLAEHCHPPLTTVKQPIYQIGEKACEMLIQKIRGEALDQKQILFKPDLVIRQSSGAST